MAKITGDDEGVTFPRCPDGLEGTGWNKAIRSLYRGATEGRSIGDPMLMADPEIFQYLFDLACEAEMENDLLGECEGCGCCGCEDEG